MERLILFQHGSPYRPNAAYYLQKMKQSHVTLPEPHARLEGGAHPGRRLSSHGLALALFLSISVAGCATTLSPAAAKRTPPGVIELAKSGTRLDLIVELDATKINELEDQSRKAQGASFDARKASGERRAAFTALKQRAFPAGKVGNGRVKHDFSELPMVVVELSDIASLTQLLENPLVKYVTQNKEVQVNLY